MAGVADGPSPPQRRSGPKPTGRIQVTMTVMVTPAQRAALKVLADAQGCSVGAIIRRFLDDGLATPVPATSDSEDS